MQYFEFTGKTVEEAVEKGLQELGLTKETADIRVLEEGKKKLFASVKARVEIAALNVEVEQNSCEKLESEEKTSCQCEQKSGAKTEGERAVEFLEGLFDLLNITASTELVSEGKQVEINVTAANSNSVIGKRGATLDAVQTLAGAVANIGREEYLRVVVDCENYRETREETLKKLAENLAQKAIRLGRKVKLEPMNPYERRIIHAALSEREGVKTESEGKEPNRYIVVIPDNLEDETLPALAARNEKRDRDNKGGYNNRGNRGGYNKGGNRGGYNKGGNGGKSGYNKARGAKGNFKREGVNSSGNKGTSLKSSSDFFGIFLGNSGNSDKE